MKKQKKMIKGLMGLGLGVGVGSQVLGSSGSVAGQQAMGNISGKMPMLGSMAGVGMVMDNLGMMKKQAKKMFK